MNCGVLKYGSHNVADKRDFVLQLTGCHEHEVKYLNLVSLTHTIANCLTLNSHPVLMRSINVMFSVQLCVFGKTKINILKLQFRMYFFTLYLRDHQKADTFLLYY